MRPPAYRPVAASKFDALFTSRPIRKEAGKKTEEKQESNGEREPERGKEKDKEKAEERVSRKEGAPMQIFTRY